MDIKTYIEKICKDAKEASRILAKAETETKNAALQAMAKAIMKNAGAILSANAKDVKKAKISKQTSSFIERLTLNKKRVEQMAVSINEVSKLPDPCGEIIKMHKRPNGLKIAKMRVPIGVIGIIYESRPNVTSDCASLCLKSANAVILKGGKESLNTNSAICSIITKCLKQFNLPQGCIQLIESDRREATNYLLKMDKYIDLIMPRGGEALIKAVAENSSIPVIKHYKGICAVYVDKTADLKKASDICFNAKVQRPGVCNAMETMLVDKAIAGAFLPGMVVRLQKAGVEIRGCEKTFRIAKRVKKATLKDFQTEFLDLILAVKVVNGLDDAIRHINTFGSSHSDAIVAQDYNRSLKFLKEVDSACVYANASTRFTDGYEFGMGAEIGISTDKLHARGPMGLEELTTYKYIVFGNGQIRL
ncbi:MAG: glutamate-5-semialdehyde dehydrogenase [Candidatus Omnitrophota bacterium]